MKTILIGWNENAQKCLVQLIKHHKKPFHIFLPANYKTDDIQKLSKINKIPYSIITKELLELENFLNKNKTDLLISVSCPYILPPRIINKTKLGAINVHASFLPELKGIHPINWALLRDLPSTGVSIHFITKGIDEGDIIVQRRIPISDNDTASTLRKKITTLGAQLLINTLDKIANTNIKLIKQNPLQGSYAPRRRPEDGLINWHQSSRKIFNHIRSLSQPDYPSAFTYRTSGEEVKIIKNYLNKKQGIVLAKYKSFYLITTSDGVICVKTDQPLIVGEILNSEFK